MDKTIQQQIWGLPAKATNVFRAPQPDVFTRLNNARQVGINGTLLSLPFIALNVAQAPKGYRMADALSDGVTQLVVTPVLASAAYVAISLLLPGVGTGIAVSLAASGIAAIPSNFIGTRLNRRIRQFKDLDRDLNRLQLGYKDSAGAQLQRQMAIRDMSGAFGTARRYLGNEAMALHR